jgi:nitrite reductase/ring-hydroxylating ferredoxin subunit/Fe-S cluster biogenesis protein NfuA
MLPDVPHIPHVPEVPHAESPPDGQEQSLEVIAHRLDGTVRYFEEHPNQEVRERVLEMLGLVDALHREGIRRLVELLWNGSPAVLEQALNDPAVNVLLQLYEFAPGELEPIEQAEMALMSVRPYIESHGGVVELLNVEDGVVHLRLSGSCQGCAGSAVTLKRGIEAALREGFPGFAGIEVHEPPQAPKRSIPANFIPLQQVGAPARAQPGLKRPVFTAVGQVESLPPGSLKGVVVEGKGILMCNVAGEIYAYRDACPGSDLPLHMGHLNDIALVCPWHNCLYDARTGKRLDGVEGRLDVIPVAVRDGEILLAVNVEPVAPG